jgi:hypothetical protein
LKKTKHLHYHKIVRVMQNQYHRNIIKYVLIMKLHGFSLEISRSL